MDEVSNKNQINSETISPRAPLAGIVVSGSASTQQAPILHFGATQPAAPPPSRRKRTLRVLNMACAAMVFLCALVFIYGIFINKSDVGWGFMGLMAGFWGAVTAIVWILLLIIYWFAERPSKAAAATPDAIIITQKKRAYTSLYISIAQCVLFASYPFVMLLVGKVPDWLVGISLLMLMFIGPVISCLVILGILYATMSFKTPYRNIGIWALALQAVSLSAVGVWALIDWMTV
jgi:hypothetical protein